MIEARELRIGNLIRNEAGNIIPITIEILNDIILKYIGTHPIELTEEWFIKSGFGYNDLNGDSGHWQIKHPNAAGLIQILQGSEGDFTYNYQAELKFLHQLQNLFFCLCDEELELK